MTYPCCPHCEPPCPPAGHTRRCPTPETDACRMPSSHAIDGVNGALLWGAQSAARFPAHDPPERHQ